MMNLSYQRLKVLLRLHAVSLLGLPEIDLEEALDQ